MTKKIFKFLGGVVAGLFLTACVGQKDIGGFSAEVYDLVIDGGRVMDPETGLNAVRNVGINGGRIAAISEQALQGTERINAKGLIVAPGFIDLHAHGQDPISNQLQVMDGVTTALEMEVGVYPVHDWLESRKGNAVINYGATVGHWPARIKLVDSITAGHFFTLSDSEQKLIGEGNYAYQSLSATQIQELNALLEHGLDEGGLGIGVGLGYTPGASRLEILRVFEMAARKNVAVYIHLRGKNSGGIIGAFQEAIALSASTGASTHVVHLNSSAGEQAAVALEMIRGARDRGLDISTESYPYTAASTRIESALFDTLHDDCRNDSDLSQMQWAATGERLSCGTFQKFRKQGGWVILHGGSEQTNQWIVAQPDVLLASDGIPYLYGPAHPRGAGTFARVLGRHVREKGALTLMEALRKMTLLPAQRVENASPSMKKKGRVQQGADADLTLFDPATVIDNATYEKGDLPSTGIAHVLVGGTFVVRNAEFVEGVFPGNAIRGGHSF